MEQNNSRLTGGCQCGAVRFRAGRLGGSAICHCRMCQKAFGSFFAPMVSTYDTVWTRGSPKFYRSSNLATRGFCGACGTPLTYQQQGDDEAIEIAVGAFDDPTAAAPVRQVNPADKLPFFDGLPQLHVRQPEENPQQEAVKAAVISYQHPDHDTPVWPPEEGFPR
jgi:hypothetical protein